MSLRVAIACLHVCAHACMHVCCACVFVFVYFYVLTSSVCSLCACAYIYMWTNNIYVGHMHARGYEQFLRPFMHGFVYVAAGLAYAYDRHLADVPEWNYEDANRWALNMNMNTHITNTNMHNYTTDIYMHTTYHGGILQDRLIRTYMHKQTHTHTHEHGRSCRHRQSVHKSTRLCIHNKPKLQNLYIYIYIYIYNAYVYYVLK